VRTDRLEAGYMLRLQEGTPAALTHVSYVVVSPQREAAEGGECARIGGRDAGDGGGRCATGCCAPTTGAVLASAVTVLFRSFGSTTPARYCRNAVRYWLRVNRAKTCQQGIASLDYRSHSSPRRR
jgi:hypothetical protein